MAKKDKRIDDYIAKSAGFAQPILKHFREVVHKTCPDAEETMKWSFPHFDYKGSMMCSMAAFKQHAVVGFWKAPLMKDGGKLVAMAKTEEAMGHLGKLKSLKDLPKDTILAKYIKEAMKLNDEGVKFFPRAKTPAVKKNLVVPDYFMKALSKNKKALKTFEDFSNSNKKEYVSWLTEAKTEETRMSRLTKAIEWLSEGKIRNWKYSK
ncbi:MAG: YdeI/OmpD-associated family protein [Bacteroidetes bacterium]|nr:YdeI/OmpD-associated family protein [Bacteroidota bacterium]